MTSASDLQHQANLMSILRSAAPSCRARRALRAVALGAAPQHRAPRRLPVDLAQIEAMGAYTIPPVEYELPVGTPAQVAVTSERSVLRSEVGELVDHQPEDVALTLRGWLAERR
jgi:flagellar biosynthesis/type III secretory pathway M-ring protein FliF/YscJ